MGAKHRLPELVSAGRHWFAVEVMDQRTAPEEVTEERRLFFTGKIGADGPELSRHPALGNNEDVRAWIKLARSCRWDVDLVIRKFVEAE